MKGKALGILTKCKAEDFGKTQKFKIFVDQGKSQ